MLRVAARDINAFLLMGSKVYHPKPSCTSRCFHLAVLLSETLHFQVNLFFHSLHFQVNLFFSLTPLSSKPIFSLTPLSSEPIFFTHSRRYHSNLGYFEHRDLVRTHQALQLDHEKQREKNKEALEQNEVLSRDLNKCKEEIVSLQKAIQEIQVLCSCASLLFLKFS